MNVVPSTGAGDGELPPPGLALLVEDAVLVVPVPAAGSPGPPHCGG